jgi:hypothetical protein
LTGGERFLDPTEGHQQFAEVLQFCPQAPVKGIEIALALSTRATVSLTEEKSSSVSDKNRGGGAAIMPCE